MQLAAQRRASSTNLAIFRDLRCRGYGEPTYTASVNALHSLASAWQAERAAVRAQTHALRHNTTLAARCAQGYALAQLEIDEERSAPRGRVSTRLVVPPRVDLDDLQLGPGDPVLLWAQRPDEASAIRGVIERRDGQALWVMLDRGIEELEQRYNLDAETPEAAFDRGDHALRQALAAAATSVIGRSRDVLFGAVVPHVAPPVTWRVVDPHLDAAQQAAVEAALRASDVALIHGPPGTGKTRTLVEVVRQLVARGDRILCTAPSNSAVDNLGERLAAAGIRIVRLGHPARVDPALRDATLDAQLDADGATALARQWRDEAVALRKNARGKSASARELWARARSLDRDAAAELERGAVRLVARAQVVLTTCVGAATTLLRNETFDTAIVDEATQASDPVLLIAAQRGKRLVLAGDPQQLGPVVIAPEATRLADTAFARLAARYGNAVMLVQQHRMHAQIMAFSSMQMYGGALIAAPDVANHRLSDLGVRDDDARAMPFMMIDTAGTCWYDERSDGAPTSLTNPGHAQRVVAEVRRLLSRGVAPADLAVIAMYRDQVKLLRELLRAERNAGVEVGTVDGFQGRERDVVIVDTVRSNEAGTIGFLADVRRMNVAVTRARRQLLVIADSATLGSHRYYAAMLAYLDSTGGHGSAWSDQAEEL